MSYLLGQLALIARRGKRDVADVVVDVDSAFVNPVRMVEAERHTSQSPPQGASRCIRSVTSSRIAPHRAAGPTR